MKLLPRYSVWQTLRNTGSLFEELYITPNKYHRMFIEKWYLVNKPSKIVASKEAAVFYLIGNGEKTGEKPP